MKRLLIFVTSFIFVLIFANFEVNSLITPYTTVNKKNSANIENNRFTFEQKLVDLYYIYDVLKENYPYFPMIKRKYGYDWLAHKQDFVRAVKAAPDDKAYFDTLKAIIARLHHRHTDFSPTLNYKLFKKTYEDFAKKNLFLRMFLKPWIKTFNSPSTIKNIDYWYEILGLDTAKIQVITKKKIKEMRPTYRFIDSNIAYLKIPSFGQPVFIGNGYDYTDSLQKFFKKAADAEILIIDIQGNSGGNSQIWSKYIVPPLLNLKLEYYTYGAVRNGKLVRKFYGKILRLVKTKKLPDLPNLPPELRNPKDYILIKTNNVFTPKNSVGFKGKIYLLVDTTVFSASEGFAVFAKITGWATIAGQNTGGDGIGNDPIVISLPNTGLMMRIGLTMGLNPDGSINAENGTAPDIYLDGKTPQDRLNQLLEIIRNNKNN